MTSLELKKRIRKFWEKTARQQPVFGVLKKIAVIVLLVGLNISGLSAIVSRTSGYFSDIETGQATVSAGVWAVETPSPSPTPAPSGVVLNEFLPNPEGNDEAKKPNGEWVELYNLSSSQVDLTGYYLKDSINDPGEGHKIYVENCRTNTGGTTIASLGFLVIYVKAEGSCNSHGFSLNNSGGDTVRLYNGTGQLIDSHTYTIDAPENKSFARIPDGTGSWVDPIPTPGEPNKLSEETVTQEVAGVASGSLNSPASASLGISGGGSGVSQDTIVINQSGTASPAPVSSESVEPLVEPLPSPEASPEVIPEPVGDDSSIQVPAEPAIPVEPVTPSAGSGQAIEPPADPPAPAPEPAPAPVEAPAPAPAE